MEIIKKVISLEPFKCRNHFNGDITDAPECEISDDYNNSYGYMPNNINIDGKWYSYTSIKHCHDITKQYKDNFYKSGCHGSPTDIYVNEIDEIDGKDKDYLFYRNIKNEKDRLEKLGLFDNEKINKLFSGEEKNNNPYPENNDDIINPSNSGLLLQIYLTRTIDNLGEYTLVPEEWEGGKDYNIGDYIMYDNDCYRVKGKTYEYKECPHEFTLLEEGMSKIENMYEYGYDNEYAPKPNEKGVEPYNHDINAITESKLDAFKDKVLSYDVMGNILSGKLHDSSNVTEDTTLDLYYHKYNTCDMTITDMPYYINGERHYVMFGDILTDIIIYTFKKDENGIIIKDDNGNIIKENVTPINGLYGEDMGTIYGILRGNEYVAATFKYKCGVYLKLEDDLSHYKISEDDDGGVSYEEDWLLSISSQNYLYDVNGGIPLFAIAMSPMEYNILPISQSNQTKVRIPLTHTTYNTKFSENTSDRDYVNAPLVFEEYNLGISSLRKVESDIYVNRGISNAFEKFYALGSVKNMESLLQYGNGFFEIKNNK